MDVEFGAKVEMSIVNGFLRIEDLRWDAYNESTTFQELVESYRRAYGHYPERVLADTIFRTRENMKYCKRHGIHLNGPKLGKPSTDPAIQKQQKKLKWQESGEQSEIERNFGVGKRWYCLERIVNEAEGNQRSDDPCLRLVHESAEEAPASFAPLFQMDSKFDSEPLGKTDFCSCLKNGICAGDTTITSRLPSGTWTEAALSCEPDSCVFERHVARVSVD